VGVEIAIRAVSGARFDASWQSFVPLERQTASFGVAQAVPGDGVDDVIARTDTGLDEAKGAGRNRVREAMLP